MPFSFNVTRAAQLTAFCIRQSGSNRLNIMKLLKLLYIADRESLRTAGYVLTGDEVWALPHGPVLSRIYDLSKTPPDSPFVEESPEEQTWCRHFVREGHDLRIAEEPGTSHLSKHDMDTIAGVVSQYGELDQFELRDLTHRFPEWRNNDPGSSRKLIPLRDILEALGKQDAAGAIEQARREEQFFSSIFGD